LDHKARRFHGKKAEKTVSFHSIGMFFKKLSQKTDNLIFTIRKDIRMLNFFLSLIDSEEDKTLFARIYEEYRQKMFKYALQFLKDEGNAEDIVQEVFLFIVKSGVGKIRNIEQEGNLWAYLSAAVRNRSFSFLREQDGIQIINSDLSEFIGSVQTDAGNNNGADYDYLVETIRGLNPVYADVLYYAFVQEMPSDKIAKLLHLSPAAVRKRISRGKEILKEKLGKDYFV
jgi:RNA polymerase sigma-70 factor (ECF subfamily)